MSPLSNLAARDVETLVHPYINLARFRETGPLVIERGQGVYVYDTDGKPYIEGMAGLWCTALGYGNEELVEAAATQMRKLSFAHLFTGQEPRSGDRAWPKSSRRSRRCRSRKCSSAIPVRRRTTPRSSLSGISTMRSAGRRKKRSSAA